MKIRNPQLKYVVYIRKSTDSEDKQVQSLEDQARELKPLISANNIKVVKWFEESRSAKTPGRPAFNEMLEMIRKGKANGIVCWKLNRLARNPIDGGQVQWMVQNGVIQSILTPGKEYLTGDNVLLMAVELGLANQYVIDLSNDILRGMKSKVVKGWRPHRAPIGYLNDRGGIKGEKRVYTDPERAPIIRKMWDALLSGHYTVEQIRKKATNEWGLRIKATRKSPTKELSSSGIYKIFTNPFYFGEFEYQGETWIGKHKPIITKQEFDTGQKMLGGSGKPRPKWKRLPFNGCIRCYECGGMITCEEKTKQLKTGKTRSYMYHHCTKKKGPCSQKCLRHEKLVEQVIELLDSITIPEGFLHWALEVLRDNNKLEETNRELIISNHRKNFDSVVGKIQRLVDLYVSADNANKELLTEEEFKAQKNLLISEKTTIESQIRQTEESVNDWVDLTEKTFNFATYAKVWFSEGDYEKKTQILRALGQNITLKDGKLRIDLAKPYMLIRKGLEKVPLTKVRVERLFSAEKVVNKRQNPTFKSDLLFWSR